MKAEVSEEEFERALDILCAYEPNTGYSLGDLLGALCLALDLATPWNDKGFEAVLRHLESV